MVRPSVKLCNGLCPWTTACGKPSSEQESDRNSEFIENPRRAQTLILFKEFLQGSDGPEM